MKKAIFAVAAALAFSAGAAQAGGVSEGVQGGAGVSGQLTVYTGTITGGTSVVSNSNAVTAAEGSGNFTSNQVAGGNTIGTAAIGGATNIGGTSVVGTTSQNSTSFANGTITGNAQTVDASGSIINGGQSFDSTTQAAQVGSTFNEGSVGGAAAIQGYAAIGAEKSFGF